MTDTTEVTQTPAPSKLWQVLKFLAWVALLGTALVMLAHSCAPTPPVTPKVIVAQPKPEAPPCACDKPAPKKPAKPVTKVKRKKPVHKPAPTPPAATEEELPRTWFEKNTGRAERY